MEPGKGLDARWIAWLREWMLRGGDMSRPVQEMRRLGFSDATIFQGLEAARPRGNALANGAMQSPPLIRRAPQNLRRIDAAGFALYTLAEFLDPAECAELVGLIGGHLKPSPLSRDPYDAGFRTSTTANLYEIDHPVTRAIDEKICKTLGIRAEYSEGIQAQRYDVGQQFKPHWDYFVPDTDTYRASAACVAIAPGHSWSISTRAWKAAPRALRSRPRVPAEDRHGAALEQSSRRMAHPTRSTMHCGEAVMRGHKIIITKWFRVHGDGPVFHEDWAS